MPAAFEKCRKKGGRIRTISGPRKAQPKLESDEYCHICIIGGQSYLGEIKEKKNDTSKDKD